MSTRIVFMGSPEFACPSLRLLAENYLVAGVVTQPDRPAGRGRVLTPPAVKTLAQKLGLPIIQPNRLKEPETMAQLTDWTPDLIVVVAFGQILRQEVLSLPQFGCINVHGSLLPRWRGAAPIQAAILHGDPETGISIMLMDAGLDTGPVISQRKLDILPLDTALTLSERMSLVGAALLIDTLPLYLKGKIRPQPQESVGVTYAPQLKKEDGFLESNRTAEHLERQVRACNPWPGAHILWQEQPMKILRAHVHPSDHSQAGELAIIQGKPALGTVEGYLVFDEVQPAGKRPMPGIVFLQGAKAWR
jgi:methionyl-tRNA formyltransferase